MVTFYSKPLTFRMRKYEDNDNPNHPHDERQRNYPHRPPTSQLPTKQNQRITTSLATSKYR